MRSGGSDEPPGRWDNAPTRKRALDIGARHDDHRDVLRAPLSFGTWLVVVAALVACRSTERSRPPDDVAVPKPAPSTGSADGGGAMGARDEGWLRAEDGVEPVRADRATALEAIRKAPQRAVVVHDETIEECSGAGGSHVFFTLSSPAKGVVHFGGHGASLNGAFQKGEVWVAGYEPLATPESVKNDAWCVPDRTIDGRALALVPAESLEDGVHILATVAP